MKVVRFIVIVILLSLLISYPNYNNPIDPDADDYQGWVLLEDGEEGEPLSLSGIYPEETGWISDLTPLIDWAEIDNASQYELQWGLSTGSVAGSTVYTIMTSEYQIALALSVGDYVFWRLKVINSAGGSSSWSDIFSFV